MNIGCTVRWALRIMILTAAFIINFFSSRSRHTRYWRDWSSDVCSSDLSGTTRAGSPERSTRAPSTCPPRSARQSSKNCRRGSPEGPHSRGSKTNSGRTAPSGPAASQASSRAGWSASLRSRRNQSSAEGTRASVGSPGRACRSAVGGGEPEVRPVVLGDEVDLLGVLLDVVTHERAVGEHGQPALPGGGEHAGDERRADSAAADGGVDLGVRQRHGAVLDVVAGQADDPVAEPDLEAPPIRDVDHARLHAGCPPPLVPAPLPGLDMRPETVTPRRARECRPAGACRPRERRADGWVGASHALPLPPDQAPRTAPPERQPARRVAQLPRRSDRLQPPRTPLVGAPPRTVPVRLVAAPLSGSGAGIGPRPATLVPPSTQSGPAAAAHLLHLLGVAAGLRLDVDPADVR